MDFDGDAIPYANALWSCSPQGFPNQKTRAREAVAGGLGKLRIAATNKPTGGLVAPVTMKVSSTKDPINSANKAHAIKTAGGQISLLIIGEAHPQAGQQSGPDQVRAAKLINAVATRAIAPSLTIVERGMTYNTMGMQAIVKEESMCKTSFLNFNQTLSIPVRSVVVAGFMFWVLASGDQRTNDFIVAFFGEEHSDIFDDFEYLCSAKKQTGVDWLDRRPRSYCLMRSLV